MGTHRSGLLVISAIVLVLLFAVIGAVLVFRGGTSGAEPSATFTEVETTPVDQAVSPDRGKPPDRSETEPGEPAGPGETVVPSTAQASAGPVTDDLMLHALQRWRPADDDTGAPRFTGRPIRILDRTGTDDVNPAGRSDRFLLAVLDGAEDEELRPEILSRSRDAVLRRLEAIRELPAEPTGVYTFLDTTVAGVREYILLLPDDAFSVTVYETTDGIEDIEIGPFDETGEP